MSFFRIVWICPSHYFIIWCAKKFLQYLFKPEVKKIHRYNRHSSLSLSCQRDFSITVWYAHVLLELRPIKGSTSEFFLLFIWSLKWRLSLIINNLIFFKRTDTSTITTKFTAILGSTITEFTDAQFNRMNKVSSTL